MKRHCGILAMAMMIVSNAPWAHEDGADEPVGQFGIVAFETTCSTQTRTDFNRAVAILHSFWYSAAEKQFQDVAKADPGCAMAHWGVAMTYYHQIWAPPSPADLEKGREAVRLARKAGARTEREAGYVEAIAAFYDNAGTASHADRTRAYSEAMERLHQKYPYDKEAAIFYALALEASAPVADKTYAQQRKAAAILEDLAGTLPDHPGITHYLIHAYDYPPLAKLGLAAARRYAKIAPSSAHALHMPSHVFIRLGLWDEAIEADLAAAATARKIGETAHPGLTAIEQLHSMDYLMYSYLQLARYGEAGALLEQRNGIVRTNQQTITSAYAFAAIPARFALERRRWDEAATLTVQPADFPWDRFAYAEAITHFARAMGAARTGKSAAAAMEIAKLASLRDTLVQKDKYWAAQVEIERKTAQAWLTFAEGKSDEAIEIMREAADQEDASEKNSVTPGPVLPARELYADMLLESGRAAHALLEYEAELVMTPNRHGGLSGAARAARQSGNPDKAGHYEELLARLTAKKNRQSPVPPLGCTWSTSCPESGRHQAQMGNF